MASDFTKTDGNKGYFVIECDECGSIREYYGTFGECIKLAKADGWQMLYKAPEEYDHICPNCKQ